MIRPLEGVRIVDLSRAMAGPYCTALLADLGADILKLESLNGGDVARQWPPFEGDHSLYFDSVNRNKRSICVDFYAPEGREILDRLIAGADVLVENFKLGTLDKMGLTREHLHELNPGLVIGSVSGFGRTGPLKDDAGLDQVVQGMSGLMSVTGSGVSDVYRVGVPIVDITAGMICAVGILAALVGRSAGRPVRHVTTSLLETALNLSVFQGQRALSLGETPEPQGNNHPTIAPYGTFATATEAINIAVGNDRQWRAFCELLAMPEALTDPRFVGGAQRSANRDALKTIIDAALTSRPAVDWIPAINRLGIPCGPIYDYPQAFASTQVAALDLIHHGQRQDGTALPSLRGPLSLDGAASEVASPPPRLGEHTIDILREIGYTDDGINQLEADGRLKTTKEKELSP